MAAGKSGNFTIGWGEFDAKIFWTEAYDAAGNYSTVSITGIQISSAEYGGTWYPGGYIKVNGSTVYEMDYNAPATHVVTFGAGSGWANVAVSSGKAFPWTSGKIYHNTDGTKSTTIEASIELYRTTDKRKLYSAGSSTIALTTIPKPYKLSVSAGVGSTIQVSRRSSPKAGAGTGVLSNGATVYAGDVLSLAVSVSAAYELSALTVNGAAFSPGDPLTVTGNISIVATTRVLGFARIDDGTGMQKYLIYIDLGDRWGRYVLYLDHGTHWGFPSGGVLPVVFAYGDGEGNLTIVSRDVTAVDDGEGNITLISDAVIAADDGEGNVTISYR